jgi:glycosyltransferase involved in cell wall biosynthesis
MVTHNLARQFAYMGHRVFVVYTTPEEIVPSEEVNYEIIWARDAARYRMSRRALNIFPVAKAVYGLASRIHVDIIQGVADEAALLHFVAGRNNSVFTMGLHRPLYPKLRSVKFLARPDRCLLEHLCFLEWYAYSRAKKVFAVSDYSKRHVIANLGLRADKIEVVYNGIASEFFDVPRERISPDEVEIVTMGRLEPQKGIDILLESLPPVVNRLKDKKIHLTVCGRGPCQEEYEKLAESLGILGWVSFVGWVDQPELAQRFSRASLCVLPSRVESFGLTIGEAMAAGIPTISTNTSAIPEIITHGVNGLLVPPEDSEALAEAIIYAIESPAVMNEMAEAGKKRIKECFTWGRVAEKYCRAYDSLLNIGPARLRSPVGVRLNDGQ